MHWKTIQQMNKFKCIGAILLAFLSFNVFAQSEIKKTHYIFIIDNTTSMEGITCGGCPNIWSPVKEEINRTISQLDENQESVITIYTFSDTLQQRHFNSIKSEPEINQSLINRVNKDKINKTISALSAIGQQTCIYNSFGMLIDKITADHNRLLKMYNTRIFLYTDSDEACRDFKSNCKDAFSKWCDLKSNQDFASIIQLKIGDSESGLLSCISDPSCIEVVVGTPEQSTIYIENDPFINFSSSDTTKLMSFTKSINLANYQNFETNSSIRFEVDKKCFSLIDQVGTTLSEVDILEHTLYLSGINNCELQSGDIVTGKVIYDQIIYEDKKLKLILLHPEVEFKFVNEAKAGVKHIYRTK